MVANVDERVRLASPGFARHSRTRSPLGIAQEATNAQAGTLPSSKPPFTPAQHKPQPQGGEQKALAASSVEANRRSAIRNASKPLKTLDRDTL